MWELDIFMFRKVRGVWSDRGRTTSVPIIQLLQNLRIEPLNWLYGHRVYNQRPSQFLSIKLVAAHLLGDCFVNFQSEGQSPKGGWVWIIVMESNWVSENTYIAWEEASSFLLVLFEWGEKRISFFKFFLILVSPGVLTICIFKVCLQEKHSHSVTDLINSLSSLHALDSRSTCTFDGLPLTSGER